MSCARSGWTDSSDLKTSCAPTAQAVADDEDIARLLHSLNAERPKDQFKREDLFGAKGASDVKNVCLDVLGSQGASLTRCSGLSDDAVRARSLKYAEQKEGRVAKGAILGSAKAVRSVRSKITPDKQIVYVYDDPTKADGGHCVVRCTSSFRTEGDYLRTQIASALSRRVVQDV